MRRLIFGGLLVVAAQVWAQAPDSNADAELLCARFVPYATDLVTFVERAFETGFVVGDNEAMRRAAGATIACAEAELRLRTREQANAGLAVVERQFETGVATSLAVLSAQVEVEKAGYCEAELSYLTQLAEAYDRRRDVGLSHPRDLLPMLADIEVLVPVCGQAAGTP